MVTKQCAICGKKQKLIKLYPQTVNFKAVDKKTFSARRTPDRIHYQFVRCKNCGLIFSNPILEPKKINKFYEKSYFSYDDESRYLKKLTKTI